MIHGIFSAASLFGRDRDAIAVRTGECTVEARQHFFDIEIPLVVRATCRHKRFHHSSLTTASAFSWRVLGLMPIRSGLLHLFCRQVFSVDARHSRRFRPARHVGRHYRRKPIEFIGMSICSPHNSSNRPISSVRIFITLLSAYFRIFETRARIAVCRYGDCRSSRFDMA